MLSTILANTTVAPWILGVLFSLIFLTATTAVKAWRDMKRSPYFFLRRQAESRLQTYSFTTFGLILATLFIVTYAWQPPQDTTPRYALLTNEKPPKPEITDMVEQELKKTEVTQVDITEIVGSSSSIYSPLSLATLEDIQTLLEPELPEQYNQFDPVVELNATTKLTDLTFSTEITDDYEPVESRRVFPEGEYTVYATFDYYEMADGMEWAWVWRLNGEVVEGGNELWAYGSDGPGYIYLSPEEGFESGQYSLEVWVNDELLTQSTIVVNNAAVSANN